jgi:hypothetical protein
MVLHPFRHILMTRMRSKPLRSGYKVSRVALTVYSINDVFSFVWFYFLK